jgi:hypothetical protein
MMHPVGLEKWFDFGGKCGMYFIIDEEAFDDTEILFVFDFFRLRLEY